MSENKRLLGTKYENIAADYLRDKGYTIIEHNFRDRTGEIDIIALDEDTIVFTEVKYRKNEKSGYPEEAVSESKMRRISKTADFFCMEKNIKDNTGCRFDVIAIDESGIRHYENAFMYRGSRYRY